MVSTNYGRLVSEYEDIVAERDLVGFGGLVGAFTLGAGAGLVITSTVADFVGIPTGSNLSTRGRLKLTGVTLVVTLGLALAGVRVGGPVGTSLTSASLGLMVFTSFFLLGSLFDVAGIGGGSGSQSQVVPSNQPVARAAFNSV